MAKDDYFVIVYKILSYLYKCLKDGERVEERLINYDSPFIKVNEKYWSYIIWHMQKDDLIEGVVFSDNNLGIEKRCKYEISLSSNLYPV